jgi:hypothetical protein
MLKRHGIYCFLYEEKPNVLRLLAGGMVTKLEQGNINYYFEKMVQYSEEIKAVFGEYRRKLESVSDVIKRIGGTGTIHGCIVDIDYFNHIYINPTDGKIIPYFALSITKKFEYSDVSILLLKERPDLYDNCIKLLNGNSEAVMLLKGETNESIETPQYVPETDIYKLSRKMRQLQYLLDANVIRIWSDQVQILDEPSYLENQTECKLNEGNHLLPS